MRRNLLIVLLIIPLISVVLSYHSSLNARKNPLSGILPPARFHRAVDVNAQLMTEEELEPVYPDLHLVVNVATRKVTLYDNGREVLRYDVGVGLPAFKTPVGPQEITIINWNPWWFPPASPWAAGSAITPPGPNNPLGVVKMPMDQGIRLHGTNADSSVGRYASHGCLRMHNDEATNLAWYIQKRINESDDSLLEAYRKNRYRSFYVDLNYSVTVDIIYTPVEVRDNIIYIYHDEYGRAGNPQTEVLDTLMKNGVDIKKIDASELDKLKYPRERYDVIQLKIGDLIVSPERDSNMARE